MKYLSDHESNILMHYFRNFMHFIILQRKKLRFFTTRLITIRFPGSSENLSEW